MRRADEGRIPIEAVSHVARRRAAVITGLRTDDLLLAGAEVRAIKRAAGSLT